MRRFWNAILVCAFFLQFAAGQQPSVDLILINRKIFTSDSAYPYAQALAIRGERAWRNILYHDSTAQRNY